VLTRLALFAWLADLEAIDAAPERQNCLWDGGTLAGLAATEGLVSADTQGHTELAQLLARLEQDGWIAWDWTVHGGDPRPEQPPPQLFDYLAIQRVRNIRIRPEGYAAYAAQMSLRGRDFSAEVGPAPTVAAERDVFVSHASEDKDEVARPLAEDLAARGFDVWFDEYTLEIGDSLRRKIDEGLAHSRFGVVILSHAFFSKDWPQRELDGLVAKEIAGEHRVILPIWHGVGHDEIVEYSPTLADRVGVSTDAETIESIGVRISRVLNRQRGLTLGAAGGQPPSNHDARSRADALGEYRRRAEDAPRFGPPSGEAANFALHAPAGRLVGRLRNAGGEARVYSAVLTSPQGKFEAQMQRIVGPGPVADTEADPVIVGTSQELLVEFRDTKLNELPSTAEELWLSLDVGATTSPYRAAMHMQLLRKGTLSGPNYPLWAPADEVQVERKDQPPRI
jgi:hypothetical protein